MFTLLRPYTLSLSQPCRFLSTTNVLRAGHNKWSKIKHKKGLEDGKKAVMYGKASRAIAAAALGGGSADPSKNGELAAELQRAKASGVPKDTIEAALARAIRRQKNAGEHQLTFEAMAGDGAVGLIIECATDNQNRTLQNIRDILARNRARLAPVMYKFERKGCIRITLPVESESQLEGLIDHALASSVDDFEETRLEHNIQVKFICTPTVVAQIASALASLPGDHRVMSSDLIYVPKETVHVLVNEEMGLQLESLVEHLEDDPDCVRVWTTPHRSSDDALTASTL